MRTPQNPQLSARTPSSSSLATRPFASESTGGQDRPPQEPYEREAQRVAGRVMQSLGPSGEREGPPGLSGASTSKPAADYGGSGGRPLPESLRHRLGQSLGADLSPVRVHTDARADRLNRSLDSNAATVGGNIFFRHGEYQPESRQGQELIAHEAVHTVHQGAVEQSGGGDAEATIGLSQSPLCGPQRSGHGFDIPTGRFAKGLKKRVAKSQSSDSYMTSDPKRGKAIKELETQGKGGRDVVDLSHKSSAKASSVVAQGMAETPEHISDDLLDALGDAAPAGLSKRDQAALKRGLDSAEKYQGSTAPMSPGSQDNVLGMMGVLANKNEDNVRYRDSTENRSIGAYPHPNVESGNMSPRSERQLAVPIAAAAAYRGTGALDSDDERLLESYAGVPDAIKKGKVKKTEDFPGYRKGL